MKAITIVNKNSSGASRLLPNIKRLTQTFGDAELLVVAGDADVEEVIRTARRRGVERLIVAGGDGTISRVVDSIAPDLGQFELAVLPTGTGNDFARSLGIPSDNLQRAWELATRAPAVPIDLVSIVNERTFYCMNAAAGGIGGKIAKDLDPREKQRWGAIAYWMTAVSELVELEPFELRLEFADETFSVSAYGLVVSNGRYVGGGFTIAPGAFLNDGLMDVTVIPVLPTVELLAAGLNYSLGFGHDAVKSFQTSRLRVHAEPDLPFSIDGDPTQTIDASFKVLPAALQVVAGTNAPGIAR